MKLLPFLLIPISLTAQNNGWIVLPSDQYKTLRAQAYPAAADPEPPPVDATLTKVDYNLRLQNNISTGTATLIIDVVKDGWVRVPIPAGLLIRQARLDNRPVAIVGGAVLLQKTGRAVLNLDIALPINTLSGDERLTIPAGAGITRALITPGRDDLDVHVQTGMLADPNPAKWLIYARGDSPINLSWRRKAVASHPIDLPLKIRGTLTQLLSLGEDSTALSAEVSLEIVQGSAREIAIDLPNGVTVNQVSGATVADWQTQAATLTVKFLDPVERTTAFVISAETKVPTAGVINLPLLHINGVERETGSVAVEVLGAGELKNLKTAGLDTVDAANLPAIISSRQSPSLSAFRFSTGAPRRTLSVELTRYAQQAVLTANVEEARYRILLSQEGKTLTQARYAVRSNQRNFLRVTLPAGATLWSASVSGRTVRPGQTPDGSILLPLTKTRGGEETPVSAVEVLFLNRAQNWTDKGQSRVILPAVDLPISRTGLSLHYPPLFRVTTDSEVFRTSTFEPPRSPALRDGVVTAAPAANAVQNSRTQQLVDTYNSRRDSRRDTAITVGFPSAGPSLFLIAELTAEGQPPSIGVTYQHDRKGGSK